MFWMDYNWWFLFPGVKKISLTALMCCAYSQVCGSKSTNLNELYEFCQEDWSNIKPESCQKLADGYQKGLVVVQLTVGH